MPQFLADIKDGAFTLSKDETLHLKVSRVREGQNIKIFDGKGSKYLAAVEHISRDAASGKISAAIPCLLPKRQITLCFCVISRPCCEDLLDKCTQAGAFAFQPVFSERSEADLLKKWQTKAERWHQIAMAAAKQCDTPLIPQIYAPLTFAEAVKKYNKGIICYEDEHKTSFACGVADFKNDEPLAIFTGPEGGFTEDEISMAKKSGLKCVSLGVNILRAETAAAVACWAALQ